MRINPFNPQQPARPDFFVGREPEITRFEKFLLQTMAGSPMNMSITGNRGIGKTSLITKIESISKQHKCMVIRLSNYEGNVNNIMDFADFVITNIKTELISKSRINQNIKNVTDWITSLKPQIEWNDITLSLEKKQLVQEYFRKRLIDLWDKIRKDFKACVILIDEAESLEKIEGIFQFLREVFQRVSIESKYIVVLAGKLNFSERMSESFSPLNRFFPVHRLKPFNNKEINEYIQIKLRNTSVSINEKSLGMIASESEGHPYVLVSMCYVIFDALNDTEIKISENFVERTLPKIHAELEKDFFSPMYHPLTPKAKEILSKITTNIKNLDFTFQNAVNWTKLKPNYVSPYIQELLKKGIINKPERGKYRFFHKLFIEYIKRIT